MQDQRTDVPYGYCECGCGDLAPIAKQTAACYGWVKGQPKRFIKGHSQKLHSKRLLAERLPVSGATDECWEWDGPRNEKGYGLGAIGQLAHRLAYERQHGEIPAGLLVCHRCDNPPCCNPAHLFLGTNRDNMDDMLAKGRSQRPPNRKLTSAQVDEIRAQWARGDVTQASLAREYDVPAPSISLLLRGKLYRPRKVPSNAGR